jgi:ribosomal protein S18 acetylase RimI-like enzyme
MAVEIKEVSSRKLMREFIHLPAKIHQNHSNWVPPIYMDEWTYFNSKKNHAFDHCTTILYVAEKAGEIVGRIMGIISHQYNESHKITDVRFCYLETYDDSEVFNALIDALSVWARNHGMNRMVGPLGFSDKDPQGWLIEGYNEPIVIATNCNFPYSNKLAEELLFTKEVDLVVYRIPIPEEIPEFYKSIYKRFISRENKLHLREFTSRRQVKPYIYKVLTLVNLTFSGIYGFVPFTLKEMDDFANRYLYLINPRFIKLVLDEKDEVVAFLIAMSHISEGIQKSKGYLLPLGFIPILTAGRKSKQLNLLLGGIDPEYQGRGLDVMMGIKLIESAKRAGKTVMDSHLELENNLKVRAEMEKMGGQVYKRYRIYQKSL